MAIAKDVIIIWPSTNASIPSGFTRVTTLDALFAKGTGNGVDPNVSGGAATHTHTSPSHTHTMDSHTHPFLTSTTGSYADNTGSTSDAQIMTGSHSHSGTSDAQSGGDVSDALTYASVSNNPPYYSVIFIKATSSQNVPANAIVFTVAGSAPSGFTFCDGSGTTPDLRNKYLLGASAGADSGATGGSLTNIHDISHTHTGTTHTHTGTSDTQSFSNRRDRNINHSVTQTALFPHSHSITLDAQTVVLNSFSGTLTTVETVEPLYKKLNPVKNTSGGAKSFIGMIGMWLGTLASIPSGWAHCNGGSGTPDMTSYHLKCSNTMGEASSTGGSNSHTHAAQSHALTASGAHSHTGSVSTHVANDLIVGNGIAPADPGQNHILTSVTSVTPTYQNANTTANSSSNEPQYLTVAFIQYLFEPSAGLLLALL